MCVYVRMCECVYVGMCVCVYVYTCICVYVFRCNCTKTDRALASWESSFPSWVPTNPSVSDCCFDYLLGTARVSMTQVHENRLAIHVAPLVVEQVFFTLSHATGQHLKKSEGVLACQHLLPKATATCPKTKQRARSFRSSNSMDEMSPPWRTYFSNKSLRAFPPEVKAVTMSLLRPLAFEPLHLPQSIRKAQNAAKRQQCGYRSK